MATGSNEEVAEELRLAYVATTRPKDFLYVLWPLRYYTKTSGMSDRHSYAQCSRFFSDAVKASMELVSPDGALSAEELHEETKGSNRVADRLLDLWK
jgi:ATP-dependent exoDNAse (exonuclease V) beta subunit